MSTGLIVLVTTCGILTAFGIFLMLGVLRQLALMQWRLDQLAAVTPSKTNRSGLKVGATAPDFELPDPDGKTIRLCNFADRSVLLVFTQPG